jgi:hypothetical protein
VRPPRRPVGAPSGVRHPRAPDWLARRNTSVFRPCPSVRILTGPSPRVPPDLVPATGRGARQEDDVTTPSDDRPALAVLSTAAATLARGADLDHTLRTILHAAVDAVGADLAALFVSDPDRAEHDGLVLQLAASTGLADGATPATPSPARRRRSARRSPARARGPTAPPSPEPTSRW